MGWTFSLILIVINICTQKIGDNYNNRRKLNVVCLTIICRMFWEIIVTEQRFKMDAHSLESFRECKLNLLEILEVETEDWVNDHYKHLIKKAGNEAKLIITSLPLPSSAEGRTQRLQGDTPEAEHQNGRTSHWDYQQGFIYWWDELLLKKFKFWQEKYQLLKWLTYMHMFLCLQTEKRWV